jgi:hypothetical protein
MATHPNPTDEILTHLMHPNLAQITRTWIAISIITGKLHDTDLFRNKVSEQDVTFSYTDTSIPKDLINWSEHNTNTPDSMHIQEHSQSIPSCLSKKTIIYTTKDRKKFMKCTHRKKKVRIISQKHQT